MNDECREFASAVLFDVEFMTDKEFNDAVKKIQKETEYHKNGGYVLDGFSAMVFYDRSLKQFTYMELPLRSLPQPITKEQARILKKELRKLYKA